MLDLHGSSHESKSNWLRAAVLGANDGIVSMAGLVLGVAGATTSHTIILTAGLAGLLAGAISMAAGEYISVSSSKDLQESLLEKEKFELKNHPKEEIEELAGIYEQKGLSKETAKKVAEELTAHDPIAAHFDAELGLDPDDLISPWQAAFASCASFTLGGVIPLATIHLANPTHKIPITFGAVIISLAVAGFISAKVAESDIKKSIIRVIIGGGLAMAVTYGLGRLFGVSGVI